jgi:uncharacterized membrane protein YfcA
MSLIALALLGFVASVVASVTGGSSLITVPVLMLSGMAPANAVATNMLVLTSLSAGAAARFRKAGTIPRQPTLGLVALSVPGSMLGALFAVRMNEDFLRGVVAVAMVAMTLLILLQPDFGLRPRVSSRRRRIWGYAVLGVWSIYGGMFSGGYATALTMGCTALLGLPLLDSVAVTRVVNLAGSLAATLVFVSQGKVYWTIGSAMSLAALGGGWVGAHLALRWGPQTVRRLLFISTVLLSGKLLYDVVRAHSSVRRTPRELAPNQE